MTTTVEGNNGLFLVPPQSFMNKKRRPTTSVVENYQETLRQPISNEWRETAAATAFSATTRKHAKNEV